MLTSVLAALEVAILAARDALGHKVGELIALVGIL
jgi:hypothetical protein